MAESFDTQLSQALDLLPKAGEWVEFNTYKANLYAKNPEGGQAVFAHAIKKDLLLKKLDANTSGQVVVYLARKS